MNRKSLRDLFFKKHFRNKIAIRSISSGLRDSFDKAYKIAKSSIANELKDAEEQYAILNEKTKNIELHENAPPSDEAQSLFEDMGDVMFRISTDMDVLLSLEEMRVVFFFKTLEKAIGEMIGLAFPKINKNDLFRWEAIVSCLNLNDINIKTLEGYQEVNHLRIVNNNIKHSTALNAETKKISYWKDETDFTHNNLAGFIDLVQDKVLKFMEGLGEAIILNVFELDDVKLEKLANEIADRLDSNQITIVINKLKERL